ncbi:MAG TPA: hypothetical protein VGK79_00595 [Gaiellaceae bacterium]|jgi:hypothetical protein
MPAVEDIVETELERVERWRAEELIRAGYDPGSAAQLAARHDVDIRRAAALLANGCPPDLALQILL